MAATNALSGRLRDGRRPVIALNLTAWPGETLPVEMLADVLRGGAEAAAAAGCLVVGGHTIDDPEPKYGLAVVGMADPRRLMTVDRARDGDLLVLTKPIGTGVVATAHKRGAAPSEVLAAAVDGHDHPERGGQRGGAARRGGGGHRRHRLRPARPPAPDAARERDRGRSVGRPGATAARRGGPGRGGFISGGTRANVSYLADAVDIEPGPNPVTAVLLHDAQTSGGLLIAVRPDAVDGLRDDLRAARRGTVAAVPSATAQARRPRHPAGIAARARHPAHRGTGSRGPAHSTRGTPGPRGPAPHPPRPGIGESAAGCYLRPARDQRNGVPRLIRNKDPHHPACQRRNRGEPRSARSARPCPVLSDPLVRVRRRISARHDERGTRDVAG